MSKATYMTQKDALELVIDSAESKITRDIPVSIEIGNYKPGDTISAGEDLTDVIANLVSKYQTPGVNLTLNPPKTLYEKGVESISSLKIIAVTTKTSEAILKIEYYIGNDLVGTYTSDDYPNIGNGGTYPYDYTGTISVDTKIKVVVYDTTNKSTTKEITIKFVGMSYYGILSDSVTTVGESDITSLNTKLQDKKEYVYSGITTDYGKICYAFPKSFGALTSIKDTVNNINYTNSFTRTEITMSNGLEYYCYTLTDPAGMTNIQMTFA